MCRWELTCRKKNFKENNKRVVWNNGVVRQPDLVTNFILLAIYIHEFIVKWVDFLPTHIRGSRFLSDILDGFLGPLHQARHT